MPGERDALVLGGVIGDVLDPFIRTASLRVIYDARAVINVCELRPSQVANPPRIEILDNYTANAGAFNFYTLVMVDPDSPSPGNPTEREYLHWLVSNIPGTAGIDFGDEVAAYESPQPWMGIHRYVFVLFRQQMGWQRINAPAWRQNFMTREFAHVHNLGPPIAALYFTSQRESSGSRARRR